MRRCCALSIVIWLITSLASADENGRAAAEGTPSPGRQLLEKAYKVSQHAEDAAEFTKALRLCRDAKQITTSKPEIAYIRTLAAWIYNKRGEWYANESEREDIDPSDASAVKLAEKALRDFDASIKLDPNGAESWKAWHNRGVSRAAFGRFEEAIRDFDIALERKPRYQNAWFNRAELHYQLGNYRQAEGDYDQAVKLDPRDAVAVTGRAHSRYHQGKYESALEDYNLSIRLQPEAAEAYADRADLYAHTQYWESAARDYRVAISLDKSLARAYKNVAWLMATCPEQRFRNPEMAVKAATKAVELAGKDDYRFLEVLSVAHSAAGKGSLARQTLQQAIAIAPDDAAQQLKVQLTTYTETQE